MSMWTDTYCYIDQCGSSAGSPPVGAALFDPAKDAEFARSIGGMIWPRGYVAASAFWHYDANTEYVAPRVRAVVGHSRSLRSSLAVPGALLCANGHFFLVHHPPATYPTHACRVPA